MEEFKRMFQPDQEFYDARNELIKRVEDLELNVEIESLHPNQKGASVDQAGGVTS